jgi:hypothetical protein
MAVGAPAAHAETTANVYDADCLRCEALVYLVSGPENNRLKILYRTGTERWIISDSAPIEAGRGCAPLGPARVRCRASSFYEAYVRAAEGDDRVTLRGSRISSLVSLGAGDDAMRDRGAGDDLVVGDAGDDDIRAGARDDYVDGGQGDDLEIGGAGRDRLGSDGPSIVLDTGVDVLRGGPGADTIEARDGWRDRIDCGENSRRKSPAMWTDRASIDPTDDPSPPRCERVRVGDPVPPP